MLARKGQHSQSPQVPFFVLAGGRGQAPPGPGRFRTSFLVPWTHFLSCSAEGPALPLSLLPLGLPQHPQPQADIWGRALMQQKLVVSSSPGEAWLERQGAELRRHGSIRRAVPTLSRWQPAWGHWGTGSVLP